MAGLPERRQAEKPTSARPAVLDGDCRRATHAGSEEGQIFFSDPFDVRDRENIEIRVRALGTNFWLGIDGDLVDEQTGRRAGIFAAGGVL